MRYQILGPLRVLDTDGREVEITAGRDRTVLAMLLLHRGRAVGADELIDAVWGENPPATARGQVQTCVSRLRRLLPPGTIRTDPAGYALDLGPDDLDAAVFTRVVAAARSVRDPDDARRLLRAGLDRWQGPALTGLGGSAIRGAALVLDEQHAATIEDWVDLELAGGRARDLLAELGELVREFPLRERLRGQLIRALIGAGRTTDALAEYDRIATALRDEIGIDPGAALRELRDRLRPSGPAVPGLPRPAGDFTGRDQEVARLRAAVQSAGGPEVVVIDGMAGVGKTTLAVHLAGLVGDRYPDAHLFVDLQGHSDGRPLEPGAALLTLLRRLGVDADRIPAGTPERLAQWRTRLAGRRVLVIFDNAATSAQVDPMLPPGTGHLAIVTSRRRLRGLDGVRTESIGVLDEESGVALLGRIAGDRVAADPGAAAAVVRRCGGLPLAIRLAGARLAHRPQWRLTDLLRRLDTAGLPGLAAEDRSVAGVFALSYGQLTPVEQRAFGLLGVHPDARFDGPSIAALTGLPLPVATGLAETFLELHLIEEPEPERYRLHDLMREYAAILARADPAAVDAAVIRLATHYREVVEAFARGTQNPSRTGRMNEPFTRPELVDAVGDRLGWLEVHRSGLAPVVDAVRAAGAPGTAWRLAQASFRFCFTQGYVSDLLELQQKGLDAARADGDPTATAESLYFLAAGRMLTGRLRESIDLQRESLRLHLSVGDSASTDKVRLNTAGLLGMVGRLDEAWAMAGAAVDGWWRRGEGFGWLGLTSAGEAAMGQGRYADALRCHRLTWVIAVQVGHPMAPATAIAQLGEVWLRMGRPRLAATLLREGIRRKAALNYRVGTIGDLTRLAVAHRELGELAAAVEQHEQALAVMAELHELRWESVLCNDFAGTLVVTGDKAAATDLYRRALRSAQESEIAYEQARALAGLGHHDHAQAIFERMGAVERFDGSRMEG